MRYKYKVTDNEGKVSDMEAMSFKKLKINVKGIEPK